MAEWGFKVERKRTNQCKDVVNRHWTNMKWPSCNGSNSAVMNWLCSLCSLHAGCVSSNLPVWHSEWPFLHTALVSSLVSCHCSWPVVMQGSADWMHKQWLIPRWVCLWVTRTTCFVDNRIMTSLRPLLIWRPGPVYLTKNRLEYLFPRLCDISFLWARDLFVVFIIKWSKNTNKLPGCC